MQDDLYPIPSFNGYRFNLKTGLVFSEKSNRYLGIKVTSNVPRASLCVEGVTIVIAVSKILAMLHYENPFEHEGVGQINDNYADLNPAYVFHSPFKHFSCKGLDIHRFLIKDFLKFDRTIGYPVLEDGTIPALGGFSKGSVLSALRRLPEFKFKAPSKHNLTLKVWLSTEGANYYDYLRKAMSNPKPLSAPIQTTVEPFIKELSEVAPDLFPDEGITLEYVIAFIQEVDSDAILKMLEAIEDRLERNEPNIKAIVNLFVKD
jgi:hypothetical protein